jgi:hypothetical protein
MAGRGQAKGSGRLATAEGPEADAARVLSSALRQESKRRAKDRVAELKALSEDEVKARLGLTQDDFDTLQEIINNPQRNAMAQLAAIKLKAQFTVPQPKQEFGGDIGVQVIVNTMRRALPAIEVSPEDAEPGE